MIYSAKAKELHDFISQNPGKLISELKPRYSYDIIQRLVNEGVLVAVQLPKRGGPKLIYPGTAPPQTHKVYVRPPPRPRFRPNHDGVIRFLQDRGEATLGQIAAHLKKESNHVSGLLLRMTSDGLLVRRRILGKISGRTQSCEWYSYRLSEV